MEGYPVNHKSVILVDIPGRATEYARNAVGIGLFLRGEFSA